MGLKRMCLGSGPGRQYPGLWERRSQCFGRTYLSFFPRWSQCSLLINLFISLFFWYVFKKIFIYLFGCTESQLRQVGSLVAARQLLSCSMQLPQLWHVNSQLRHTCGIQFPDQGSNLGPLHWECRVLSTVPPGKSLNILLKCDFFPINGCRIIYITNTECLLVLILAIQ